MVDTKNIVMSLLGVVVLTGVGLGAIALVDSTMSEPDTDDGVPPQEEYDASDSAIEQVSATFSKLSHVDHRQDTTAVLKQTGDNETIRRVDTVTKVSHSSEKIFVGTKNVGGDGVSVEYRFLTSDAGGVVKGAPGQSLESPPRSGWEMNDASYTAESAVPSVESNVSWSVKNESESTVVYRVNDPEQYRVAWNGTVAFDELYEETYLEVHIDKESGSVVKIVDHQVGVVNEENGSVRGPFSLHREVTFEYRDIVLETPSGFGN